MPLRIDIGPKDVAKNTVVFSRRDILSREGKSFVSQENLAAQVKDMLGTIQAAMLHKATIFRDENIHEVNDFAALQAVVQDGWAFAWWCGSPDCEAEIKAETKATNRCIPLEQPGGEGSCVYCGKTAQKKAYFARAY